MLNKLNSAFIILEAIGTLALAVTSVYMIWFGRPLEAIYFILGATWLGRGQVARYLAKAIAIELAIAAGAGSE